MTASERPGTLCEAFQRTAAIDPDAVALRTPGDTQTVTWRDFATRVRQVAAGLAAPGVGRGDTVSLMMAPCDRGPGTSDCCWSAASSSTRSHRDLTFW